MKKIKIFLASSAELEHDRKAFETFLYRKAKVWQEEKNVFLELINWEDFIDAISKTRLQDEYNQAVKECDIFVMLFWTKVGMYTNEEFETASAQFQKTGKPLIYTFFKDVENEGEKQHSLETFIAKLKGMGHFQTVYKNTEDLLFRFSTQLDKLYSLQKPENKTAKEEIMDLINKGNLLEAFEELNKHFKGENDSLNTLMAEYIDQPNNFNNTQFLTRLKMFINRNW